MLNHVCLVVSYVIFVVVTARDCRPNYTKGNLPVRNQKQKYSGATSLKKAKKKLTNILARGCIAMSDELKPHNQFFPFPKTWKIVESNWVSNDIMMFYDDTRSALNKVV